MPKNEQLSINVFRTYHSFLNNNCLNYAADGIGVTNNLLEIKQNFDVYGL